ncbi:hypothetical protein D3C75_630370 [compost metagenome]
MINTYLVDGSLRIGVEIPELQHRCCEEPIVDLEIPIVVIGDSTRSIPWNMAAAMAKEQRHVCKFIMDLLLINGPCNRYMEVTFNIHGLPEVKSLSSTGGVSDIIHRRATNLQKFLAKDLECMNVLTVAQRYAVKSGIAIEQRKHDE